MFFVNLLIKIFINFIFFNLIFSFFICTKNYCKRIRFISIVDSWHLSTGFGKFNLKVMAVCSMIFMNVAFSITSIGFILPSAACDFRMTTMDKGRLSAAPMLGNTRIINTVINISSGI